MLRTYDKYRRKLANLRKGNKNVRRQGILQKHIDRLFEKLTVLKASIKLSTVAASVAIGTLAFAPQTADAQAAFLPKQVDPFGINSSSQYYFSAPTFADIDGDGDLDMLSGSNDYNYYNYNYEYRFKYYENIGTAANPVFAAAVDNPFGIVAPTEGELTPTFVDLDNDGDMDIFYGDSYGNLYYMENTGTATVPAFAAPILNPFGISTIGGYGYYGVTYFTGRSAPTFADLDGDGDLDLLSGGSNGRFYYFENTGSATVPVFTSILENPFGFTDIGNRSAPVLIDIDGDGDFDLLSGDGNGNFQYLQNTGTAIAPAFAAAQMNPFNLTQVGSSTFSNNSKPAFADLDNDGDMDLMAGDANDGEFTFYRRCTLSVSSMSPTAACSFIAPSGQTLTTTGVFTDIIPNATGCDSVITINLTIVPIADQTVTSTNPIVCGTGSAIVDLGSSQLGVNYFLRDNANDTIVDGPIAGTGSTISFNTGNITAPKTYNVFGNGAAFSTGLFFDGMNVNNHKVECGNNVSVQLSGNQITLEAWIYPTDWKNVNQGHIINKENNGPGTDFGYMIRVGDNGKINFNLGNGNWNELTTTSTPLVLNSWQHVAATYDGATMSVYVDGNLIETKNDPSINFSSAFQNLTIGSWAGGNGSIFAGNIDEVRVWSVSRTQSEIQADLNTCLTGSETGLAAYYQFEDGSGSSTLTDLTPNGNNGTLTNMDINTTWVQGSTVCVTCNIEMTQTITIGVGQNTTGTISPIACNSFTSPSGNYTWTSSATYLDTIPNAVGCDSVITINLTIDSLDNTTSLTVNTITATQAGATYRWLDCNNSNAVISGETAQSFTATVNGNYAVEITNGICVDTSACENVIITGIEELTNQVVSIYPNPTNSIITVDFSSTVSLLDYTLMSIDGKTVTQGEFSGTKLILNLENEPKGIYFLKVENTTINYVQKVFKN